MLYKGAPHLWRAGHGHKCWGGPSGEKARRVERRGKGHACSFLEEGTQLLHTRAPIGVLKHGDIWESAEVKVIHDAVIRKLPLPLWSRELGLVGKALEN